MLICRCGMIMILNIYNIHPTINYLTNCLVSSLSQKLYKTFPEGIHRMQKRDFFYIEVHKKLPIRIVLGYNFFFRNWPKLYIWCLESGPPSDHTALFENLNYIPVIWLEDQFTGITAGLPSLKWTYHCTFKQKTNWDGNLI